MSALIKFLSEHRNGATHDDIAEKLRDLVAAVSEQEKGGSLTISIKVAPRGKGDGFDVEVDAKLMKPKAPAGRSIFFATPDNNLTRQDPNQREMDLRDVSRPVEHKEVG